MALLLFANGTQSAADAGKRSSVPMSLAALKQVQSHDPADSRASPASGNRRYSDRFAGTFIWPTGRIQVAYEDDKAFADQSSG